MASVVQTELPACVLAPPHMPPSTGSSAAGPRTRARGCRENRAPALRDRLRPPAPRGAPRGGLREPPPRASSPLRVPRGPAPPPEGPRGGLRPRAASAPRSTPSSPRLSTPAPEYPHCVPSEGRARDPQARRGPAKATCPPSPGHRPPGGSGPLGLCPARARPRLLSTRRAMPRARAAAHSRRHRFSAAALAPPRRAPAAPSPALCPRGWRRAAPRRRARRRSPSRGRGSLVSADLVHWYSQ